MGNKGTGLYRRKADTVARNVTLISSLSFCDVAPEQIPYLQIRELASGNIIVIPQHGATNLSME
jgi:hypothetical protein